MLPEEATVGDMTASELAERLKAQCTDPWCITPSYVVQGVE